MDKKTLSKYRGEVIEKFINIESIIDAIITQYYFKRVLESFVLEVLYDEYFSFGLKRRILQKILQKIIPDSDNKKIQDLNRLNNIRNLFAHYGQEWIKISGRPKPEPKGIVVDPRTRNLEKGIDFEKLYEEFIQKDRGVTTYLGKIFTDLGGVLVRKEDNST